MSGINITPAEWEVMRVLWANGEVGSADIVKILQKKRSWKPTTTKTLLARLVAKYAVETREVGNKYLYRPMIEEDKAWRDAARELFGFVCAKDRGAKIAQLIETRALTGEDILLIQESLANATKQSVAKVDCDCFKGQCSCNVIK